MLNPDHLTVLGALEKFAIDCVVEIILRERDHDLSSCIFLRYEHLTKACGSFLAGIWR